MKEAPRLISSFKTWREAVSDCWCFTKCTVLQNRKQIGLFVCVIILQQGETGLWLFRAWEVVKKKVRLKPSFCFVSEFCVSSRFCIVRALHFVLLNCNIIGRWVNFENTEQNKWCEIHCRNEVY